MNEGYAKGCGASEERRPSQACRAAGTQTFLDTNRKGCVEARDNFVSAKAA